MNTRFVTNGLALDGLLDIGGQDIRVSSSTLAVSFK